MLTTIAKWVSLAASLLFAFLSWVLPSGNGALLLGFVIWAGIIVSLVEALTRRKYGWAASFAGLGLVFNPVVPVLFRPYPLLVVSLACAATFAASLMYMQRVPRLTIASITDTSPRSESL